MQKRPAICHVDTGHLDLSSELDRGGAELLFQVITEREETNSLTIASNASFSG